ncbi:MAG: hypothetical protein LKG18_00035 [Saccharofermentans sp.]|jgi:hypothetical protein|nr:hypothetical protein [Saccharofermentans sp.]
MNTRKKILATALAFLIGFSPMVPGFITCADETGSTQETTVSETTTSETSETVTEASGETEPSETAAEQTESIKSAGGEGTVYCCKLLRCMKVYDFRQLFQKLTKIKF